MGFSEDLMGIYWDLMELMGFNEEFIVIHWDSNGIYLLVN